MRGPVVLVLATVLGAFGTTAAAQPRPSTTVEGVPSPVQARSPRNANYTISARLDPAKRTIIGSETIVWRNITNTTATELQFHLYWNAWQHARTTFMREQALGGIGNDPFRRETDWSRIEVTSIKLLSPSSADLTGAQHFITPDATAVRVDPRPDDGSAVPKGPDDQTVMAVALPQPAPPGSSVTIELNWTARIPHPFARTGAVGNFFFIAQWFPKLGVLEDAGWNCHQFHAGTEFFSDFGVYDVSLTVPQKWIVGATGLQRERRDNADGTATHRYYQEDVHDFVWTTSPDFLERTALFEHPRLPPVRIRLLLQPEHAHQAGRHLDATRTALKYYGEWFGAYPYGHITVVDPAYHSGAGGMEYPTLFTAGTRWLAPERVASPEGVTVHEAGHQFWYGIVANNEFEHAWMDEGFNQFSTARAVAQDYEPNFLAIRYFGGFVPWVFTDVPLSRETQGNGWPSYRRDAKSDAEDTPSYKYFPSTGGSITYSKTALWLNTLERWIGWPSLQRVMSAHFERWKFKHPKPEDFVALASEVSGRDLSGFFDQVYRSSNVFDYGVQELKSTMHEGQHHSSVVVRRYGEAVFPVDVLITFEDGQRITEHWNGADRWKLYEYERPSAVASAQVDPGRVLLLDVNHTNNSRTTHPRAAEASTKWSMTWMVWLEDCLLSWIALV